MTKTIVSVSKKHNSVWRIYFYELDDDDNWKFYTKRINSLLVWFYKLRKAKLCNDICNDCGTEIKFYKRRFEKGLEYCSNCDTSIPIIQ